MPSSLTVRDVSTSLEMTKWFFAALDIYHDTAAQSAAANMAIDEALLEAAKIPAIRFYGWNSPALSFGYFGKFVDVADYAPKRDLVRRWTGGGIVLHGEDLTYSIVIPASDAVFAESAMSIYEKIHRALTRTFVEMGREAVVAADTDCGVHDNPRAAAVSARGYNGHCFANPVRADVLINGRKVAGAAQRRTRAGILQQGSIQATDPGNGLADRFALSLSANCSEHRINQEILDRARELAQCKYGTDSWLRKH